MKSSSIRMVQNGIASPRVFRDCVIHDWYLPTEYKQHVITNTRIASSLRFFDLIKDGEIKFRTRSYSIIWLSGPKSLRLADFVIMQMRWVPQLDTGYVLVKQYEGVVVNGVPFFDDIKKEIQ